MLLPEPVDAPTSGLQCRLFTALTHLDAQLSVYVIGAEAPAALDIEFDIIDSFVSGAPLSCCIVVCLGLFAAVVLLSSIPRWFQRTRNKRVTRSHERVTGSGRCKGLYAPRC